MPEKSPEYEVRDVIGFSDLLRVLGRRARWIIGAIIVSLAVGVFVVYWKNPVFEASAKLRIGRVAGGAPIEAGDVLAARLLSAYGRSPAIGVVRPLPYLERIVVVKDPSQAKEPSIVDLVVEGASPSSAAELLARIVEEVSREHDRAHDETVGELKESLSRMQERRAALERQYRELAPRLGVSSGRDSSQVWMIATEKSRITETLATLDSKIPELAMKIAAPSTVRTGLVGTVVLPTKASSPRLTLILPFAVAAGAFVGVLVALGLELLSSIRRAGMSTREPRVLADSARTNR